jgi:hypothetical protein
MKNRNIVSKIILLVLGCSGLSSTLRAVSPPPDGGYPGGNTAEGQNALFSLSSGGYNTAVGFLSLRSNTAGSLNTAVGAGTLLANIADNNTATGAAALLLNINGTNNTADGVGALAHNTSGGQNTAVGTGALGFNNTGSNNTAVGHDALGNSNSDNSGNTAVGTGALANSSTGGGNTALGYLAGLNVATASGVICVGALGADVDNSTWISNIYGVTTQSGTTAPVIVSDDGQLGTVVSSARFKKDIATMQRTSEAILSLRPVTFHYKTDRVDAPQFGLIAEEVAKVNPALVLFDKEGKPYTVRYDAVNVMLLNEFLKEHKTVQDQGAAIARQQKEFEAILAQQQKNIEELTTTVKEQASQLQKVSARLAASSLSNRGLELSKASTEAVADK